MSMTDSVANMLTSIRNGNAIYKPYVDVPHSNFKHEILSVLKQEKYIKDFEVLEEEGRKKLRIHLLYLVNRKRAINEIKKVSLPGKRVYCGKHKLPIIKNNLGIAVLTSPRGIVTNTTAREQGVGGEILFYIW